ncbi:cadherin-related family member 5 [Cyprinodon tularosa]|uniref:cadherin-related family member 5 n=1 Tax=Cyprinodon tularosa TaxID=77115 RepID=UPI0018E22D2E|nr:cadherin-related family member 5 [Cyprinodon tularosa]
MALSVTIHSTLLKALLVLLCLRAVAGMSGWSECLEGRNVFVKIKENSPSGDIVAAFVMETGMEGVWWSLSGKDAHWFYLDGRNIRLNTSEEKILDREKLGPILMAELSCYERDMSQTFYKITVEILNENDNLPMFSEESARSITLSELTPVNTVAFTVQALDADNDKIIYSIDQTSPDAKYFRIDLPNSGEVILSKPLDYETQSQLTVTIHASEMNTAEHYNISTNVSITVQDGDDQYPQFQPCVLLFHDENSRICTSPVYMVNVTEGEEDILLDFSPGPIHAVDGDRALSSSISYAIISEDEEGHFSINRENGELRLTKGVKDRLVTPVLRLQVMAYQNDDPRKYSVATVLVRVLAENWFHPEFELPEYHGFVTAGKNAASLVNTYGSRALILKVLDPDFDHAFNPMIHFMFAATSNHTDIYQVTRGGLIIARTSHLKQKQKHILEITAVDQESGDAAYATVTVEVLPEGQSIPHSPPRNERLTGCTVGKALFLSMLFMGALGCILSLLKWLKRKYKGMKDPLERGCVAQCKHPNVSLHWFQLVNHHTAMPNMEELSFQNEEYGTCNPSFSLPDTPVINTTKDIAVSTGPSSPRPASLTETIIPLPTESVQSPVILNNSLTSPSKISCCSPECPPEMKNLSPKHEVDADRQAKENASLPCDVTSDPSEEKSHTDLEPVTNDDIKPPPLNEQDLQTTSSDNFAESVPSPSSPSRSETASTETNKPLPETNAETASQLPSPSLLLLRKTGTPPLTLEHDPLKATLVHIDTSPTNTPPESPVGTEQALDIEVDQPSTSPCHVEASESEGVVVNSESPSPERRPSTNSGNTLNSHEEDDEEGFLGDDDVDKNSEEAESEDGASKRNLDG